MALFGKKADKVIMCPICKEGLPERQNKVSHYASHAIQTEQGDYIWKCSCGEEDGAWKDEMGAGAGLAQHFEQRHGISMVASLGIS
jgi:hypothetical protein